VYQETDGSWLVKNEFEKFEADGLEDRAIYVLENSVDVILQIHRKGCALRWLTRDTNYVINLQREGVNVYDKADRTGPIVGVTPTGVVEMSTISGTPGLKGDGTYWLVMRESAEGNFLSGYIHEDDVVT
jgi:hypothetical protein